MLGIPDNPVRRAIESLDRQAGLDFIVNVILDSKEEVIQAVAGDIINTHRVGCEMAKQVHHIDVPLNIEPCQANKGIEAAADHARISLL
ncbi:hypothetical protein CSA56_09035 [candidate division KSB3 bacterium]|uniref:Uncharacterized protein n=1 Tax=candidate division KSB3 bacterium TaxID=2044937 RepID=A0A2G6KEG7_9BACT|nr:MAG: hypothetical protein CSA56_09035 [candidate division KSB3 bacterium]